MTPLAEAQEIVLRACPPFEPVDIDRRQADGLVLAAVVTVAEDVPPFDNSAVDGYAVRAADVRHAPVDLMVVGELAAGAAPTTPELQTGETVRTMTGAPIAPGADAVVMVERSTRLGGDAAGRERVRLSESVVAGAAVRRAGSDVRAGDALFPAGTVVSPAVGGVLASVNAATVMVHRRAVVAVLSTGDELVDDGSPLQPGQIRESNLTMLRPMLADAGCDVVSFGIVPDDEAQLEAVLRDAAVSCDAIVTSGGVSMGDYDVVKAVLGRIADMTWMQVAIKPAKPFAFGTLAVHRPDSTGTVAVPVFGLPGNPVSSLVSFELFARPALRRMMGHRRLARPSVVAIADTDLARSTDGKTHFVRVVATAADDGRIHVSPVSAQGSHQLAATALANGLAVVPDGDGISAGGDVATLLFSL